jgi:hypothetical protein
MVKDRNDQCTITNSPGDCRVSGTYLAEAVEPRQQAETEHLPELSQPSHPQYKSEKYLGLFFGILTAVILSILLFFAVIDMIIKLTGVYV